MPPYGDQTFADITIVQDGEEGNPRFSLFPWACLIIDGWLSHLVSLASLTQNELGLAT